METIRDEVFGEMLYKHGWVSTKYIEFWNETINFKIKVVDYDEKAILESQRQDFLYFMNNTEDISKKTYEAVKNYISDNSDVIYPYIPNNKSENIKDIVIPKTLLFDEEHVFGILCDCLWDDDGIGIQVLPCIEVDSQDILL